MEVGKIFSKLQLHKKSKSLNYTSNCTKLCN